MDLLEIADAEHGYIAINGECVSLSKLISTQSISMTRTGRDGYSYEIECSGNGFTATARHRPAPAGSSIRYPNFSIDASLERSRVSHSAKLVTGDSVTKVESLGNSREISSIRS